MENKQIIKDAVKVPHSSLVWLINIFLFLVVGVLILPLLSSVTSNRNRLYYIATLLWAKFMLLLAGISIRAEGIKNIPKKGALIIMPNHQGHWDYPILFSLIPRRLKFVIKKELTQTPLVGKTFTNIGLIPINRAGRMSIHGALEKAAAALQQGEAIVIFPEGTRTWNGSLAEFKSGGISLAARLGVPILPVAISGSHRIMPRHTWLIHPRQVRVKFGQLITFKPQEQVDSKQLESYLEQVRQAVEKMHRELDLPPT